MVSPNDMVTAKELDTVIVQAYLILGVKQKYTFSRPNSLLGKGTYATVKFPLLFYQKLFCEEKQEQYSFNDGNRCTVFVSALRPWCIVNIFVVQVHAYMRNFEDGMLIVVESSAIPPYVHMVYRSPIGFEPFSHGRKYRWGNNSPQYSADTVDFISRVQMD